MRILCLLALLLIATRGHAQAACPPGAVPYGTGSNLSACGPAPDNSRPQQPKNVPLPPDFWINHHGAIVIDSALAILGVSANKLSEAEALQAAEKDCHAKGGLNCKLWNSYGNQCIAVASGDKASDDAVALTLKEAEKNATQACTSHTTNCKIYYSACSLPVLVP